MKMFKDYTDRVVEDYRNKNMLGQLSPRLARPSTAKLREECESVFRKRFLRKDYKTLESFFDLNGEEDAYLQSIRKHDVDKFRPLVNFLTGKTKGTEDKNIELLAWLLDFEPRPYELTGKYEPDSDEKKIKGNGENELISGTGNPPVPGEEGTNSGKGVSRRWIMVAAAIVILVIAGITWFNKMPTSKEACMYWSGDHYVPVSCNKKLENVIIVALDSWKLKNFQKITRTDTITQYSVGKVWYYKKDNVLEYYTSPGYHPVYMKEALKPLTAYIINTHLAKENK